MAGAAPLDSFCAALRAATDVDQLPSLAAHAGALQTNDARAGPLVATQAVLMLLFNRLDGEEIAPARWRAVEDVLAALADLIEQPGANPPLDQVGARVRALLAREVLH